MASPQTLLGRPSVAGRFQGTQSTSLIAVCVLPRWEIASRIWCKTFGMFLDKEVGMLSFKLTVLKLI